MAEPDRTNADAERVSDIVAALHRSIATASNDDLSEPMSDKRSRHVARIDVMGEAADIIEAQSKALAEARVVKPLEWRNVDASPQSDDWWLEAVTPFGPYTIALVEEHTLPWLLEPFRSNLDSNYATEDEAKAAAQADYQQRILSALTPTPENPNG